MVIVADKRERSEDKNGLPTWLAQIADERRFLKVPNPSDPAHPWSYDLEVVTKCGQTIKIEGKWSFGDAISTWTDRETEHSRLTRQSQYVDLLIVIWDDMLVALKYADDKKMLSTVKGLKNRLTRMNIEGPSIAIFSSVEDTISFLRYLEQRKEPVMFRQSVPKDPSQV